MGKWGKLVDIVGEINIDLINRARKVVSVLLKQARKWYWYCSRDRGVLGVMKYKLARRIKVLFGLAIEKSNIAADLMQIELPGSKINFVRTKNQKQGRRFVRRKLEQGRHVQHII